MGARSEVVVRPSNRTLELRSIWLGGKVLNSGDGLVRHLPSCLGQPLEAEGNVCTGVCTRVLETCILI